MIRKETRPFYRTSSGVRLCWSSKHLKDLSKPKDPKKVGLHGRAKSDPKAKMIFLQSFLSKGVSPPTSPHIPQTSPCEARPP